MGRIILSTKRNQEGGTGRYLRFAEINGEHPLKHAVPDAFVEYQVRTRHGGSVCFFNFNLAREMGLIAQDHESVLNKTLTDTLLGTFSLVIINEYDIENHSAFAPEDIRPNTYMATRYLQLQHPDKTGRTSGDGRSIWNGCFHGKNAIWDISSCGTGATCLSPATAIEGRYFKTGDKEVSYGCGRADLKEGLAAAINSEIFHRNGIPTERTLAIIGFRDGTSINVRAAPNLLRPAHLFRYLKQGDLTGLRAIVDYYIQRQVDNGMLPALQAGQRPYQEFLRQVVEDFAYTTALYESEYIFCWMDWDGDNILMDAGIIDYGSIRQFGLFHRQYRYSDVDRMSTTISGQRHKARYIIQTFAQISEALISGRKPNIHKMRNHGSLREFDRCYGEARDKLLLHRMGYSWSQIETGYQDREFRATMRAFARAFAYFEQFQSSQGIYEVTDGITSDAIFCMRDILRELPVLYLQGTCFVDYPEFIAIMQSDYAQEHDLQLHPYRQRQIRLFQTCYRRLVENIARLSRRSEAEILTRLSERSNLINRYERVTGDSIINVTEKMLRVYRELGAGEMLRIFSHFVQQQVLKPEYFMRRGKQPPPLRNAKAKKVLYSMLKAVKDSREGI